MRTLIVIDMQNDFVGGVLGTPEARAIVSNVKKKIQEYYKRGDKIIFTRDTHHKDYLNTPEGQKLPVAHCLENSYGWQIVGGLEVPDCYYIDKPTFGWTNWQNVPLCDDVEAIGVCSDICVVSNAILIKTMYPNVNVVVDASCCAGSTPERHKAALEVMKSCQINVIGE